MHETAIVQGLMGIIEEQAAKHGAARVSRVNVKVGRLRAVEPRQLGACFEVFAEGTIADGALLAIEEMPVRARCKRCGTEFEVANYRFACAACGAGDVEVTQGQELYIESIEVTDDGPPAGTAGPVPK